MKKNHIEHTPPHNENVENNILNTSDSIMQKFAHMVSSSIDMLVLVNKEFVYEAANDSYLKAHDMIQEQLIGQSVSEVLGEDFLNDVIKPNAEKCFSGNKVSYQLWYNFPNNGKRFVDIVYSPYVDKNKIIQGFVVCIRDKTEQQKAEEERDNSIKLLQKALEEIRTLKGIIPICSYCHDIRNNDGSWSTIEVYISKHSEAQLSHGICSKCEIGVRKELNLYKQ